MDLQVVPVVAEVYPYYRAQGATAPLRLSVFLPGRMAIRERRVLIMRG